MKTQAKKITYKRIALALSLCAILVWAIIGTGATLAWFSDTSEEVKNIFHFADFELEVSHRLPDGTWESIDGQTNIFNDEALYEPGYVQVVYLKVENKGSVPFEFKTAVSVDDYTLATNVFGHSFNLQDYLKFGVAVAGTEAAMDAAVASRDLAKGIATMNLGKYATETATLAAGGSSYMALVVRMPEEVANEANYRGDVIPKVELSIIATADQIKN